MVQKLLDKGADVSLVDDSSYTALHIAAIAGHTGVVKLLLDAGANPSEVVGTSGLTALDFAISGNYVDAVRLLLDAGCEIRRRPETLRYAAISYCETSDPRVLQLLIEAGIDPCTLRSRSGLLALYGATLHRHVQIAHYLLQAGVALDLKRKIHFEIPSALHLAVMKNETEMQMIFVKSGVVALEPPKRFS